MSNIVCIHLLPNAPRNKQIFFIWMFNIPSLRSHYKGTQCLIVRVEGIWKSVGNGDSSYQVGRHLPAELGGGLWIVQEPTTSHCITVYIAEKQPKLKDKTEENFQKFWQWLVILEMFAWRKPNKSIRVRIGKTCEVF